MWMAKEDAWRPIKRLLQASAEAVLPTQACTEPSQYAIKRKWAEVLPEVPCLTISAQTPRKKRRGLQCLSLSKGESNSTQRREHEAGSAMDKEEEAIDVLDTETTQKLLLLRKQLESLDGIPEGLVIMELDALRHIPQLEQACEIMQLHDMKDEIFLFVTKEIIMPTMSFRRCSSFLYSCVLPRVQHLEHMASRLFFMAIHYVGTMHPGPLIEGLLLPLASDPNSGAVQMDVVNRVVKECLQPPMIFNFLRAFLSRKKDELNDSDISFSQTQDPSQTECAWTEHTVSMLHNLLNTKLRLPEDLFGLLLIQLDAHATAFSPSVTFAAMLLTLVTKHTQQVSENKVFMTQIIAKCNNFMVKGIQAKLTKM